MSFCIMLIHFVGQVHETEVFVDINFHYDGDVVVGEKNIEK